MQDTEQLVKHLSKLAQLPLTETQLKKSSESLNSIMDYMEQIKSLKISVNEATARVSAEENVLRDDSVGTSFSQEEALANASEQHEGFFMVNAVIEKDE